MIADIQDRQFQRRVDRLHRLGPRVLGEMLAEIGASRSCMTQIEQAVQRYGNLPLPTLRAVGGDQWPVIPLHRVR